MTKLTRQVRREAERGLIVSILVGWRLEWMPFGELRLQFLRRTGYPISDEQLGFHLNYLARAGYIEIKRLRSARAGLELTVVRASTKAVDLAEGRIPTDPAVGL